MVSEDTSGSQVRRPLWAFGILGPIEVVGEQGQLRIPRGRTKIILSALLANANRTVSLDHLIDVVWDQHPPATARSQVQFCMSTLRSAFAGVGEFPISTQPPGYRLQAADGELDLHVFDDKVAQANATIRGGRLDEAAVSLREALALWRGPALEGGCSSQQLQARSVQLDERRLAVLQRCIDLEMQLGRHSELIGELTGLVDQYPLLEGVRGQLMRALYRTGRKADALQVYRRGRDALVDQLGLEPGEELRKLEAAILVEDKSLQVELASTTSTAGWHVGKPHQLPPDLADFIERRELVDGFWRLFEARGPAGDAPNALRVAVITGKPGAGKSALAVHVAHRLATSRFPDGQLYCDLRGAHSNPVTSSEVLGRFLRALGISGTAIPDGMTERAEMYRTLLANREVLIVLDGAGSEEQVAPLLPGSSSCGVIVTSRVRLTGLSGSKLFEINVMEHEQALELLGRVIGERRVRAEPVAADALVRMAGGLPLALSVIAARLAARPHWSLASMASRLADERHRLDELNHGDMMVRTSLSLTYDALEEQPRRLLRLLGLVDQGTFPSWSAAALIGGDRSRGIDQLEQLVDAQMLDVAGTDLDGDPSYQFHDLIRVFARERLAETEPQEAQVAARGRLLGGWLGMAEHAHRRLYGGDFTVLHGNSPRWLPNRASLDTVLANPMTWLEGERFNLCAAVTQAADAGLDELCWDLAMTLVALFETKSYVDDWQRTHELALAAVQRADNTRGTAALMCSLGSLYLNQRRSVQARSVLRPALELFDALADTHGRALTYRNLGLLAFSEGSWTEASEYYRRAHDGFREVGDRAGEADVLRRSAQISIKAGRYERAIRILNNALSICKQINSPRVEAQVLYRLGRTLCLQERYGEAERIMIQVLELVRAQNDMVGESAALHGLGTVYTRSRNLTLGEQALRQSLALREQLLDPVGASRVRLDLANLLAERGDSSAPAMLANHALVTFDDQQLTTGQLSTQSALDVVTVGAISSHDRVANQ